MSEYFFNFMFDSEDVTPLLSVGQPQQKAYLVPIEVGFGCGMDFDGNEHRSEVVYSIPKQKVIDKLLRFGSAQRYSLYSDIIDTLGLYNWLSAMSSLTMFYKWQKDEPEMSDALELLRSQIEECLDKYRNILEIRNRDS